MPKRKKEGDPIASLQPASRQALMRAPAQGLYEIPYPVGEAFRRRGWGEHNGCKNIRTGSTVPHSQFRLNEAGLLAARTLRQGSRDVVDQVTYDAVHEATMVGLPDILEAGSLDELIERAHRLVERLEEAAQSSAGARGYRDALLTWKKSTEPADTRSTA